MEIVLGLVIGAAIGLVAHFVLGGRDTRGAALAPMLGAVGAGVVWLALTWLGLTTAEPLLWASAFAVPVVIVVPSVTLLARTRARRDAATRAQARIA